MIPKPGKSTKDPTNYRPISLLPTVGKITERVILDRLNAQIEELNLMPPEQFGFRQFHGTDLQLLRIVEEIHQAMDNRNIAIGVFLDISRAFGSVWHDGLITKLYRLNINPSLVKLLES